LHNTDLDQQVHRGGDHARGVARRHALIRTHQGCQALEGFARAVRVQGIRAGAVVFSL
jgi:hypothetical protein